MLADWLSLRAQRSLELSGFTESGDDCHLSRARANEPAPSGLREYRMGFPIPASRQVKQLAMAVVVTQASISSQSLIKLNLRCFAGYHIRPM